MKTAKIIQTGNKWGILAEFEIGKSGAYESRVLISNISKKKANILLNKYLNNQL